MSANSSRISNASKTLTPPKGQVSNRKFHLLRKVCKVRIWRCLRKLSQPNPLILLHQDPRIFQKSLRSPMTRSTAGNMSSLFWAPRNFAPCMVKRLKLSACSIDSSCASTASFLRNTKEIGEVRDMILFLLSRQQKWNASNYRLNSNRVKMQN